MNVAAPPAGQTLNVFIYPTTLGTRSATNLGTPTGAVPYVIGNINDTWQVTVGAEYVGNGAVSGVTYSPYLQVFGGPPAKSTFAPVFVTDTSTVASTPADSSTQVGSTSYQHHCGSGCGHREPR